MKKNKITKYRTKTINELKTIIADLKKELANISVQLNAKKLRNVSLLRSKKKELAAILTVFTEKEREKT